jgi:hypothetical protein
LTGSEGRVEIHLGRNAAPVRETFHLDDDVDEGIQVVRDVSQIQPGALAAAFDQECKAPKGQLGAAGVDRRDGSRVAGIKYVLDEEKRFIAAQFGQ